MSDALVWFMVAGACLWAVWDLCGTWSKRVRSRALAAEVRRLRGEREALVMQKKKDDKWAEYWRTEMHRYREELDTANTNLVRRQRPGVERDRGDDRE